MIFPRAKQPHMKRLFLIQLQTRIADPMLHWYACHAPRGHSIIQVYKYISCGGESIHNNHIDLLYSYLSAWWYNNHPSILIANLADYSLKPKYLFWLIWVPVHVWGIWIKIFFQKQPEIDGLVFDFWSDNALTSRPKQLQHNYFSEFDFLPECKSWIPHKNK